MIRCEGCNIPVFGPISKACNPHDWRDKIYVLSDFCRHGQKVPIVDDFREAELNGGLPQYMKGRVEIVFLNPYTIKVCALQTSDPFFFSKIFRFLGTPHNSTILFFIILNKANTSVPGLHLLDDDYPTRSSISSLGHPDHQGDDGDVVQVLDQLRQEGRCCCSRHHSAQAVWKRLIIERNV